MAASVRSSSEDLLMHSPSSDAQQPEWLTAAQLDRQEPDVALRSWLTESGVLTRRLRTFCGERFHMRLIGELYKPDLAMLPIGDLFTMDPRQAALACAFLGVKRVMPLHYGTFPALTGTPRIPNGWRKFCTNI